MDGHTLNVPRLLPLANMLLDDPKSIKKPPTCNMHWQFLSIGGMGASVSRLARIRIWTSHLLPLVLAFIIVDRVLDQML